MYFTQASIRLVIDYIPLSFFFIQLNIFGLNYFIITKTNLTGRKKKRKADKLTETKLKPKSKKPMVKTDEVNKSSSDINYKYLIAFATSNVKPEKPSKANRDCSLM